MLGAAGFVLPEAFNRSGAICGPEAVWFKVKVCLFLSDVTLYLQKFCCEDFPLRFHRCVFYQMFTCCCEDFLCSFLFHRCFCIGWSHAQYEWEQGVEQIMWVYISMEESHCISACNFATSFFFLLFVFVWKTLLWMECGWQTGALLLDGNTLSYFGANIPVNLAAAVIAEVLLVGGAEYYRSTNKSPLGSVMPFSKTFFPQY